MEAEAIYKRRWSMSKNMRRVKSKGSGKLLHKTPNMLNKSHMNDNFFQCKVSNTDQMVSKTNNWKPWITTDLIRVLQCELCTKMNLQHWTRIKGHTYHGGVNGRKNWIFASDLAETSWHKRGTGIYKVFCPKPMSSVLLGDKYDRF